MKKAILIISILILTGLLAGCNLPGKSEPTVDIVATQVAKMLTDAAIEDEEATATLSPSPTLMEPSTEDTPTLTATATETPTETATETSTPTTDISDPVAQLGSPAWTEDFDGSSSSWDFDYDQATFETSSGYLNLTAVTSANWHSWYVSSPKLKNAYVEATILMVNGTGLDRFGLAVRSSNDGQQFYFLNITADGQWGFFRMENDVNMNDVNINEISGYQTADQLNDVIGTPHRVGIWMQGNTFTFYIDGEEIGSASDNTLMQKGYTGFLIAYANTPGFTVRVDKLQYWDIP
jgi:hypothetical protein